MKKFLLSLLTMFSLWFNIHSMNDKHHEANQKEELKRKAKQWTESYKSMKEIEKLVQSRLTDEKTKKEAILKAAPIIAKNPLYQDNLFKTVIEHRYFDILPELTALFSIENEYANKLEGEYASKFILNGLLKLLDFELFGKQKINFNEYITILFSLGIIKNKEDLDKSTFRRLVRRLFGKSNSESLFPHRESLLAEILQYYADHEVSRKELSSILTTVPTFTPEDQEIMQEVLNDLVIFY